MANYAAIHRWAEDNAIFEDALYEPSILIDLPLLLYLTLWSC